MLSSDYSFRQCDIWVCVSQREGNTWFVKMRMWMQFIFSCKDKCVCIVIGTRNIALDYYWLFATGCLIEFCLQAQVLRSAVEENCSELLLRRFDFFGRGERMILSMLPILQFQCVNYCGLWEVWLGD